MSVFDKIKNEYQDLSLADLRSLSYKDLAGVDALTKRDKKKLGTCHRGCVRKLIRAKRRAIKTARIAKVKAELTRNIGANKMTNKEIDRTIAMLEGD